MKRKIISALLVLCLVVSLIPQTVFALADTESNNTFKEAQTVSLGEEITGQLTEADVDVYAFTLEKSGRVELNILAEIEAYSLQLLDAKANELEKWENNAWNAMLGYSELALTLDLEAGTYVLRLMGTKYVGDTYHSYTGTYTIKTAYTDAGATEAEDNDSFAQANPLPMGAVVNGQIAMNDDNDYYVVEVPQTGRLSLDITSYMQYYSVFVFDAQGEEVCESKSNEWKETVGYAKNTHKLDLEPGTYFIRMTGFGERFLSSIHATGTYTLTAAFAPVELTEKEPNNAVTTATALEPDGEINGQISLNDPEDYYKVQLTEAGRLSVEITAEMEAHTFTLLDENGKKLYTPQYKEWDSATGSVRVTHAVDLDVGTFYLLMNGKGFLDKKYTGKYNLKTSFVSAKVTEREDNDTVDSANLLTLDGTVSGQIALNDYYDFYKITMPEAGKLKMAVVTDQEFDLRICNELGDSLNSWQVTSDKIYQEFEVNLEGGTYLIKMSGKMFLDKINTTGNYKLLLNHEHTWDAGVVTKLPDGNIPGEKTYTCTVCGMTKTEVYTATCEHTWQDATCTEPKICTKCQFVEGDALGHAYDGWKYDGENHWMECTRANCPDQADSVKDKAAHTYQNDQCSICGYQKISYTLYVNGVGMADGTYLGSDTKEVTTSALSDHYAYYKDGVLMLHNFTVTGKGHEYNSTSKNYAPIYASGDLKLVLEGGSVINATDKDKAIQPDGIVAAKDLEISGTGSIQITAEYAGIFAQNVTVKGGTISISAEDDGIYAKNALAVEAGDVSVDAKDVGIYSVNADIQISGGSVRVTANKEGILTKKDVRISGGTVKATGEFGIYAYNTCTVSGGKVTAEGIWKGLTGLANVSIQAGEVEVRSSETAKDNESWAIYSEGGCSFKSGLEVTASENADGSNATVYVGQNHTKYDYIKAVVAEEKPAGGLWGDANGDGKVNAKDAMLVLQYYTKKITEDKLNTALSDVDGNGKLNAKDAMLILQKYTKKIDRFPVEKNAQPQIAVSDVYSDVVMGTYCYHIPQVSLNGSTDLAANQTIYQELYQILKEDVYYADVNSAEYFGPYAIGMVYTYGTKGDVLNITVKVSSDMNDCVLYRVYNVSTITGALLSSEDLVKAYGMTMDGFYTKAKEAISKYWEKSMGMGPNMAELMKELKTATLAEENVKKSVPYINSKGELCLIANLYVPAGAGSYWYILSTSGTQEATIDCAIHVN